MASGSTGVVLAALFANGAIAVLKFVGFLLTGSPSMLSETYHSISDTGNQVFLLVGIRYSGKATSRDHPFGYGKAQFFYAFLVAVLLFGIAGWESLNHGIHAIQTAGHAEAGKFTVPVVGGRYETFWLNVAILLAAIAFETYAFRKANEELRRQMEEFGWGSIREAFGETSDATTLTAFTEDAIALAGAAIALVGIVLTRITGNGIYDAVSAAIIGVLLMGFALALAWENKRLLLGESLSRTVEQELQTAISDHPEVVHVDSFRSVFFGPQEAMVAAEVTFDSDLVTAEITDRIDEIEAELEASDGRVAMIYIEPSA
ncbi:MULTISPECIES: cation diffusion facilitator family transporter [Halolamina]|uniref:Cation diffusion facilitator family transporter n=1 Tax=Halolamina pelagica TaxID=699431 RepID=A0A1I5SE58_9EURY|nr:MULTISPECIES: cation diffusion facilitator family transporter [Halolamina]NHX37101.1 cation diffusion facilitator family transporter [Halolamina sp. R1-12]SFP68993.1 cation diffusion facilitator family transporter [Halolamina pelagica]